MRRTAVLAGLVLPRASASGDIAEARAVMLAQFDDALGQFDDNDFGMPISLLSTHRDKLLQGEVIAVIEHDFRTARRTFTRPDHWCDTLLLHLNTKACLYEKADDTKIHLYAGRKYYQPMDKATRISLGFDVLADQDDFVSVQLFSQQGPLGTSDYRIEFSAMPLPPTSMHADPQPYSLLRFRFSYKTSWLARRLTNLYLGQLAGHKVGFTVLGMDQQKPVYIKGLQGIIERNTIRYFLAIKTHLDAVKKGDSMPQPPEHKGPARPVPKAA